MARQEIGRFALGYLAIGRGRCERSARFAIGASRGRDNGDPSDLARFYVARMPSLNISGAEATRRKKSAD
jgi:hypothetical protein